MIRPVTDICWIGIPSTRKPVSTMRQERGSASPTISADRQPIMKNMITRTARPAEKQIPAEFPHSGRNVLALLEDRHKPDPVGSCSAKPIRASCADSAQVSIRAFD